MSWNPNGGAYNRATVDRIEREVVTDAMVDRAIIQSSGVVLSPAYWAPFLVSSTRRREVARNIAIGISAGSYDLAQFYGLR